MTPESWRRLNAVLDQAVTLPSSQRPAFLDDACGDDPELRRELEALLALEDEIDAFLPEPVARLLPAADGSAAGTPDRAGDAGPGHRIGPYQTGELLGRGGMGEVYLAARVDDFEQRVALKLLPRAESRGEVLRRFRIERQIQARLEHPNIGRLLDGGTTGDGRPYFAMEYVDGEAIDLYCDRRGLDVGRRLELFRKVCAAVHFAHQRLVVHRDLKPSNILVTGEGEPKLLDFGIAKLLRPESAAERLETRPGSQPLSPHYASPEQVRGQPVSTATDVYALGVLLFRLLTGRLPCGLEDADFIEALRRICCEEPERPSRAAAGEQRRLLSGDLDAVVLKALRKEPAERYSSAAELGEDLGRHLAGLPVQARRHTLRYRAGKFLRRHRWPAATVAGLLAAALALAGWEWQRLDAERRRAEKVTVFLEQLFLAADPDQRRGGEPTIEEMLARGRDQLGALAGEPRLYATLAGTLGRIHHRLGHYGPARELLAISLDSWRRDHPGDTPELARRLSNLGVLHQESGAYGEAEALYRQALAVRRRLGQEDIEAVRTLNNLAGILALSGAWGEAEDLYRRGLEIRRRFGEPDSPAVASSLRHLGWVLLSQGETAEAELLLSQALELRRAHHGERHTAVAGVLYLLGKARLAAGDRESAEAVLQQALTIRRQLLGDDHVAVARVRRQLAAVLLAGEESPATVAVLLERALAAFTRVKPAGDWEIADAESLLGAHLASLGRGGEAETCLLRAWETLDAARGREAVVTREARRRLDAFYAAWR